MNTREESTYPCNLNYLLADLMLARRWTGETLNELVNRLLITLSEEMKKGVNFGNLSLEFRAPSRLRVLSHKGENLGEYVASKNGDRVWIIVTLEYGEGVQQGGIVKWSGSALSPKAFRKVFRLSPDALAFVQGEEWGGKQATMERLMEWAVQLPVRGSLRSPQEAMGHLRQFEGQRIRVSEALEVLTRHCSNAIARDLLWRLSEKGQIRLVHGTSEKGVTLGGDRQSYEFMEVLSDPPIH